MPQNLEELYAEIGHSGSRRTSPTSDPAWLDQSPGAPPRQITGQLQLPTNPDPLPLLSKAATGLGLLGLLYGMDHWARPMLKATRAKQPGDLISLLTSVVAALTRWTNPRMRYMTHAVGKGAAHTAASPAWLFGVLGLRWTQVVGQLMYLGHDLAYAFERLRHTVIPREINRKLNPVHRQVRQTRTTVRKHGAQITTIRRYINITIERHLKPRIQRIERTVTHVLPARINRVETNARQTRTRVQKLERGQTKLFALLTVTGAVSLVLRAFTRMGLRFLTCTNVKGFGRELCASPPGAGKGLATFWRRLFGAFGPLLGELLAFSFVPFLLTDACRIVGVIESLAIKVQPEIDALVLGIEGFVCGGVENLPSAIEPSDLRRAGSLPSGL